MRDGKRKGAQVQLDANQPAEASTILQTPASIHVQTGSQTPVRLDLASGYPTLQLNPHSSRQPATSFNRASMRSDLWAWHAQNTDLTEPSRFFSAQRLRQQGRRPRNQARKPIPIQIVNIGRQTAFVACIAARQNATPYGKGDKDDKKTKTRNQCRATSAPAESKRRGPRSLSAITR